MTCKVHIRQLDQTIEVAPGATILDTALDAGLDYPFGCQSGNCGACKSRLLEGEVEMTPYSEYALTEAERAAGLILACRSMPTTDCRVAWLELEETVQHPQRQLACTVTGIEAATHDIRIVRLRIDGGGPFTFSAGQYARVRFADQPGRDFSMASRPYEPVLEFHVRAMDGGAVSHFVRDRLKVGDPVSVDGPLGLAYLRELHTGPVLAAAGGSGLAPIKSIVDTALLDKGFRQPIHLYLGVRAERDLYYDAHFRALGERFANLRYQPVLSEPDGPTGRRTGYLSDVVAHDMTSLDGWKAYLAGPPIMVDTTTAACTLRGARAEDIHADPFYNEHELAAKEGRR